MTDAVVVCPYCQKPALLVTGKEIYPHRDDLHAKRFYQCRPCQAWVGVHDGTTTPLGSLANAELRRWRSAAHEVFDPLWRNTRARRGEVYAWLSGVLGIPTKDCHISMFDVSTCKKVIVAVQRREIGEQRA